MWSLLSTSLQEKVKVKENILEVDESRKRPNTFDESLNEPPLKKIKGLVL